MQRRFSLSLALCLAVMCALVFAQGSLAQDARAYTQAPLPAPEGFYKYVNDNANVIDAATKERLATILNNLKDRADIEFTIVTIPTTGNKDIFDYSISLARGWGIGSKEGEKNGLLLLVAVNDRKWQTQVSRHLEGDMPDTLIGQIGRQRLVEPFRAGNYSQGISEFVQSTVATLAEKRGFQLEGIDQGYAYRPTTRTNTQTRPRSRTRGTTGSFGIGGCCLIAVVILILISMAGGRGGGRGRRGGGGGGGLLSAIVLGNILGGLASGGRGSSSGWGGGGGSDWGGGGGGGGGFGGFGGGGDFGGGGAGGDW